MTIPGERRKLSGGRTAVYIGETCKKCGLHYGWAYLGNDIMKEDVCIICRKFPRIIYARPRP